MKILFILLTIISVPSYGQDFFGSNPLNETRPITFESPERNRQRAINMAQRAMFAYPQPRRFRKKVEKKMDALMGKEFAATLGVVYMGVNNKEVSTRYIRNLTFGFQGGSIRPDIGIQLEQDNTYMGLFYFKEIP